MFVFEHEGQVKACPINPATLEAYKDVIAYEVSPPADKTYREAWEIVDGSLVNNATKVAEIDLEAAKVVRDEALEALVHDFGDGRVIQVRPKDESNIRNAIEIMTANSLPSISWQMQDDVKYPVTVAELQVALQAGQTQALVIWGNFNV